MQGGLSSHGVAFAQHDDRTDPQPGRGRGRGGRQGGRGRGRGGRGGRDNQGDRNNNNNRGGPICYFCGEEGHYAPQCPHRADAQFLIDRFEEDEEEPEQPGEDTEPTGDHQYLLYHQYFLSPCMFQQSGRPGLPPTWVLLDNCSTVNVFCNPDLLHNIRPTNIPLRVQCNAGVTTTDLIGDFPGLTTPVYFDPHGVANILSFHHISQVFRISYNYSPAGGTFTVHGPHNRTRVFQPSERGLSYCDVGEGGELFPKNPGDTDQAFVVTVADKKSSHTVKGYKRATLARRLQNIIGRPSARRFKELVDNNLIPNCPITGQDILAAEDIFGPNLGSLKGKTTHRKPTPVAHTNIPVPPTILQFHSQVSLCVDIMFINKLPFLITISKNLRFGTIDFLPNRQEPTILKSLRTTIQMYHSRGFQVLECLGDPEFEPLRDALTHVAVSLNTASAGEHVPDIERYIRTVKDHVRSTYNSLPFRKIPPRMIIELASHAVFWLNMFPAPTVCPKL